MKRAIETPNFIENSESNSRAESDSPALAPERAKKVGKQALSLEKPLVEPPETSETPETPETRFSVDPKNFHIFPHQGEYRFNPRKGTYSSETLNINETLGRMVGSTAATIATLVGENDSERIPPADHVIYLDKSARPVRWLVDAFWEDFTDKPRPEASHLAIDRKEWFRRSGVELLPNEYVRDSDGTTRPAEGRDFQIEKIPKETLARIRAVYIDGGIEDEDIDKIMSTPTVLDGKNVTIIDEVSRSGSTLHIAKELLNAAVPELKSVNGYVFWRPGDDFQTSSGETQMKGAPAWYPHDPSDWRGRGVKDPDGVFYASEYEKSPNNFTRRNKFSSIVLGVPLTNREEEREQLSWKLRDDIDLMHEEYKKGHILPSVSGVVNNCGDGEVAERLIEQIEDWGVEFAPVDKAKNPARAYNTLIKKRNELPDF
ncbi:hypothetical protein IKG02_03630 [Candidatus Saccharibacteria bacterium]|nr:hypothetical protein [Candidatus Saccharibacteria bacterium]